MDDEGGSSEGTSVRPKKRERTFTVNTRRNQRRDGDGVSQYQVKVRRSFTNEYTVGRVTPDRTRGEGGVIRTKGKRYREQLTIV